MSSSIAQAEALEEAESIESNLMQVADECGLTHYNGGGDMWPRTVKNQLFDQQTRFELDVVLCRCVCELSESEVRI